MWFDSQLVTLVLVIGDAEIIEQKWACISNNCVPTEHSVEYCVHNLILIMCLVQSSNSLNNCVPTEHTALYPQLDTDCVSCTI